MSTNIKSMMYGMFRTLGKDEQKEVVGELCRMSKEGLTLSGVTTASGDISNCQVSAHKDTEKLSRYGVWCWRPDKCLGKKNPEWKWSMKNFQGEFIKLDKDGKPTDIAVGAYFIVGIKGTSVRLIMQASNVSHPSCITLSPPVTKKALPLARVESLYRDDREGCFERLAELMGGA